VTLRYLERQLEELWLELPEKDMWGPKQRKVGSRLEDCRDKLWREKDAKVLDEVGEQLKTAAEELVDLETDAAPPPKPGVLKALGKSEPVQAEAIRRLAELAVAQAQSAAPTAPEAMVQTAPSPVLHDPPPPRLTEEGANRAVAQARNLQFFVIIISAFLAIASGLGALYVGKTWGTPWDVVAAIVWGATGQAVVSTFVTSIEDFGVLSALRRR
jgi:hypothetical protein